jgi:hypothetical protein
VKIKLDENIPASAGPRLAALGLDVDTVLSEGLTGKTDREVWAAAQAEGRLLVTQDLDFSDHVRSRRGNTRVCSSFAFLTPSNGGLPTTSPRGSRARTSSPGSGASSSPRHTSSGCSGLEPDGRFRDVRRTRRRIRIIISARRVNAVQRKQLEEDTPPR